ncbi:nose resistant to fluoxetine protein 6-like [Dysidea avara]|uniref:nose resistant to fluoxetine protein 6-like n=1 Tax=Dysidea avara TaxID=196820 RepID=UPI00332A7197
MFVSHLHLILAVSTCVFADIKEQYFLYDVDISESCKISINKLSTLQSIHPQLMAQYWDSWGKPSDGIVYGHTTFLGYYDECMDLKNTPVGETNYCIYTMQMNITTFYNPSEYQDEVCYSSDCPIPINTSVSSNIQVGVCYPSTCSPNEFALVLSRMNVISDTTMAVNPFSNTTQTVTIQLTSTGDSPTFCPQTDVEYDTGTLVVIVICITLLGLTILGTGVDVIWWLYSYFVLPNDDTQVAIKAKETPRQIAYELPTFRDFVSAFSLYKTIPHLFSTKQSPSSIKALGFLKLFANVFIIGMHVYIVTHFYYPQLSQNTPHYLDKFPSRMINQIFMNTTFAADTFFLISATLSSYLTLRDMDKHKRFRILYFYINRYFRLAPLLYLLTIVTLKLVVHLAQGPLWFVVHTPPVSCQFTWWYNLLFINNFLNLSDICVVPTWHVSAEMQLFIFSPIFILALYYSGFAGLVFIGICVIGFATTIGVVTVQNGYMAAMHANPQVFKQIEGLHMQPFYRANPYLVGIVLGYILHKKYSIADLPVGKSVKQLLCLLLWTTAIYLCKITLFGTVEELDGTRHFTKWENATFLMFSGLAWSIGISIIIFLCNTGYGGVVNSVLSWPGWDPVVRLSYGVYLFHDMVMDVILGTLQSSLIFTDTVYIMLWVFTIFLSFSLSVVLMLTVELPISKVVSLCFTLVGTEARDK